MTVTLQPAITEIDRILQEVCNGLQITPTQFQNAEEKYRSVGAWLAHKSSKLAGLQPEIFAQGSMALQTTVRPRTDEDSYDLDLVLVVKPTSDDPMTLYRLVEERLRESPHYRDIVERKKRCIALNFRADDHAFHMDILPGRPDIDRGGTCIEVPDRKTPSVWQPSNPRGYREWFEGRATTETFLLEQRGQEPLPQDAEATAKAVLKRTVQLMKRRRDLLIEDEDLRPRSIILTTLAGTHYNGERTTIEALQGILRRILDAITAASPARIRVPNPTNQDELFCESFKTPEHYDTFVSFLKASLREIEEVRSLSGLPALSSKLSQMYGEKITKRALMEYGRAFTEARVADRLRPATQLGAATLTAATVDANSSIKRRIDRNTFYGE